MKKPIKFVYALLIIVIVGGGVALGLQNKIDESRKSIPSNFNQIYNINKKFPICEKTLKMQTITKDGYPYATYEFFSSSHKDFQVESVWTEDQWFSNNSLNQTIVFQLGTDYMISSTIHFINNNIPDEIFKGINLSIILDSENGNIYKTAPLSIEQKRNSLSDFIKLSKKMDKSFFVTQKGISLNDPKDKIIGIYGEPDSEIILSNGILKAEWFFNGNYMYDDSGEFIDWGYRSKCGRPLVEELSGYKLRMFFEDGKLIGSIIDYYTL